MPLTFTGRGPRLLPVGPAAPPGFVGDQIPLDYHWGVRAATTAIATGGGAFGQFIDGSSNLANASFRADGTLDPATFGIAAPDDATMLHWYSTVGSFLDMDTFNSGGTRERPVLTYPSSLGGSPAALQFFRHGFESNIAPSTGPLFGGGFAPLVFGFVWAPTDLPPASMMVVNQNNNNYFAITSDGSFFWYSAQAGGNNLTVATGVFTINHFHCVQVLMNGTASKININGIDYSTGGLDMGSVTSADSFLIGDHINIIGAQPFEGYIGEIWSASGDRSASFNNIYLNCKAWWKNMP